LDATANALEVKHCPAARVKVPKNGANHGFKNDEWTIIDVLVPYLLALEKISVVLELVLAIESVV
jgi:hypothetical protein